MEKEIPQDKEPRDKSNWSHDIEERDYYYDDSTGYEVYDPDKNDDDETGSEESEPARQ